MWSVCLDRPPCSIYVYVYGGKIYADVLFLWTRVESIIRLQGKILVHPFGEC